MANRDADATGKLTTNRTYWDRLAELNRDSEFYDLKGFREGRNSLTPVDRGELEKLGGVEGKSVLHLMCHFGEDTLSLARMGADVVGADFSPEAVKLARELRDELELDAEFVQSDIYDLPDKLDREFDLVFSTWGILPWLPDLGDWAEVVAHFTRPGGGFYLADSHPFTNTLECEDGELRVAHDYFDTGPREYSSDLSYAVQDESLSNLPSYEWHHSLSELFGALREAGFQLQFFREHRVATWEQFPLLERGDDGLWRLPEEHPDLPLSFSLYARRPEAE